MYVCAVKIISHRKIQWVGDGSEGIILTSVTRPELKKKKKLCRSTYVKSLPIISSDFENTKWVVNKKEVLIIQNYRALFHHYGF